MPLKLIIFDLDGTLVDTVRDIQESLGHALALRGLEAKTEEEVRAMVGGGLDNLISRALGPLDSEHHEKVFKDFTEHYADNIAVHSSTYPGVEETIGKLKAFDLALISNKREDLTRKLLGELGLLEHFRLVVGGDTAAETKPSPEPVLHVLHTLGHAPEEALMVGDSPTDIQAAHAAGVRCVAVTYGYRDRSLLEEADFIIDHAPDIIKVLVLLRAMEERRRRPRHGVPDIYRKYLKLRVRAGGEEHKALVLDISEHGIMFQGAARCGPGEPIECALTVPRSLTHVVVFRARVVHAEVRDGDFLVGAEIVDVADGVWFKVFMQILRFIKEREGEVF